MNYYAISDAASAVAAPVSAGALRTPAFIPFVFPGVSKVRCLFTTAGAGDMYLDPGVDKVAEADKIDTTAGADKTNAAAEAAAARTREARRTVLTTCGLSAWVELHQVHGVRFIHDAEATDPLLLNPASSALQDADGSATTEAGLGLAVKTADCQPVLLTDRTGAAVAALHVGWRGNARNFPGLGVRDFCSAYGLRPQDVLAVRGPSLGPAEAEFVNFEREWEPSFRPWFDERTKTMNLWSLTEFQLTQAGLLPQNIFSLDFCTKSMPGLFFSFRRGDAGRQVSVIWRE